MKERNEKAKDRLKVVSLLVVIILIFSSAFAYYTYFKEEQPAKKEPVKVIDDSISPYVDQGLILEVLRIRHRGLYDKLNARGNSWKDKPSFYYEAVFDKGLEFPYEPNKIHEFKSKDVGQLGTMYEVLFNTWDTMFQENKLSWDSMEEQQTSTIKLTIVERVQEKVGIFRKASKDIERDSLEVVFDYRTGRWSGDDSFRDYDGYGHYVGNTFEIWFNIYENDNDLDYIPYWVEVNVLGTDPQLNDNKRDADGDGIPAYWEWKWGYDPLSWDDHEHLDPDLDGLENIEEYKTAKWLSNPYHQDVYCEIDYMGRGGLFDPPHILWEEGLQAITELYARHNINVYFDMGWPDTPENGGGQVLPHYAAFSQDSGMILQLYNHYFPDERKGIFRYIAVVHSGAFNHPSVGNVYDSISIGYGRDIKGYLVRFFYHKLPVFEHGLMLAVTIDLFHELGHSNGLHFSSFQGVDNWGNSSYDDYQGAMNYDFEYILPFDYSDGSNGPPYDQNDWAQLNVAEFNYNNFQIEDIWFEPPKLETVVYGESEFVVTGYVYDENLTAQWEKTIGDWSPVDPIKVKWSVFRLVDNEKYPNYKDVKIYAQTDTNKYVCWLEYAEGKLDSNSKIKIYNQQEIIDNVLASILKQ